MKENKKRRGVGGSTDLGERPCAGCDKFFPHAELEIALRGGSLGAAYCAACRPRPMKENKHTPGPWRVTAQGPHQFHGAHVWLQVETLPTRDAFRRENSDALSVCMVSSSVSTTAQADANLIASAPDLLAALERAIVASGFELSGPTDQRVGIDEGEPGWVALARAALARVRS